MRAFIAYNPLTPSSSPRLFLPLLLTRALGERAYDIATERVSASLREGDREIGQRID